MIKGKDKDQTIDQGQNTPVPKVLLDLWSGLLDLVYPPKCLVCGDMQPKYFCEECLKQVVYIQPPVCSNCGAPRDPNESRCRECHGVEFCFNAASAVGVYDGVLKEAIHQFKYSGHRVMGPILGELLVDYLHAHRGMLLHTNCVIPVPIHHSRERQRGFNQSDILAAEIGRAFSLPVLPSVLVRTIPTHPQVDLPIDKRRNNVERAFKVRREDAVSGRSILLVDDVFTTGSTVDSAASALRDAGASYIHVLTLARSV